jgi:DNA replication protein DnaC
MSKSEVSTFRRPLEAVDFRRMNLPDEFWRATLDRVPESVRGVVHRYLAHIEKMIAKPAGLLLSGASGVGKSAIAALVCKEARSRGFTCFFGTVWELREAVRNRIPFDDHETLMERVRNVDVLVLDGLRAEDNNEVVLGNRAIQELLMTRGSRRKLSVVTTQLDAAGMRKHFGGLLDSVQGCMVYLPVDGENQRRRRKEELQRAVLGS